MKEAEIYKKLEEATQFLDNFEQTLEGVPVVSPWRIQEALATLRDLLAESIQEGH